MVQPRGTQKAQEILEVLISGQNISKDTLTKMCGNTNHSSQISTVRCNLLVPIECGKDSNGNTIWYMTQDEIMRYYGDREFQIIDMEAYVTEKQDNRVVKNLIELYKESSTGKARVNAILKDSISAIKQFNQMNVENKSKVC